MIKEKEKPKKPYKMLIGVLLLGLLVGNMFGTSRSKPEDIRTIADLENKIELKEKILTDTYNEKTSLKKDLKEKENEIIELKKQINNLNKKEKSAKETGNAAKKQTESKSNKTNISKKTSKDNPNQLNINSGYYCNDGTYVGDADPSAKGRANACYGHKGFVVNNND